MKQIHQATIILSAVNRMSAVLNPAFDNANRRLGALRRGADAMSMRASAMSGALAGPAMALGAVVAAPLKVYADFEQAMADVGAVSRASDADLAAMTERAKEMGIKTAYSATQAADAMGFLAMAGFKTKQSIAAIPGVLDLAAAGNTDLARTADIASNILTGFGLQAEQMGYAGDVLTSTFTKSNTTLEMLGHTMKFAAPIAKTLGVDIQNVAAMAGKLGDAGIQGEMAGTALRAVMLRLAAPARAGADALRSIGVSTTDAAGNLRPVADLLAEIGAKIENLPTGRQTDIVKDIFGTEAASGAMVLLEQARLGTLQQFAADLGQSGVAAQVAAKRMNTARGMMMRLQSVGEGIAITLGEVLMPTLIEGGKRVAALAERFAAWAKANPATLQAIMKITAAVVAFLAVAALVAGVVAVLANIPVVIGVAIAAAAAAIYTHWDELKAFFSDPASWTWINSVMSSIAKSIGEKVYAILETPFVALGILEKGRMGAAASRVGSRSFLMGKYADESNIPEWMRSDKSKLASAIVGSPAQPLHSSRATSAAFANAAGLPEVLGGTRPTPKTAASRTTTVNYAPVVTIEGGDETTKAGFLQELQRHKYELGQMFKGLQQDEARVSF